MNKRKITNKTRIRRKKRTKAKIFGTAGAPRLSVFRSNLYSYAQLINDENGFTLVSASTKEIKKAGAKEKGVKVSLSKALGEIIAKKALEKGIKKAVFDRGRYKYHGRVKAVAEGARQAGLKM